VLHGGVPLTLLDAVGGRTLIDRPIPGSGQLIQSSVTVTLTVDFMRAVGTGILFASAIPDHIGKTLAYVSVKVTLDALDGDIVSRGIGTYRIYTKSLVKAI
jgi:acyl-coenzyme A thioesterase PaaI-like protein